MQQNNPWPAIEPFNHFYLNNGHHRIYVEQCGNPEGIPVLVIHGGPGGGCNAKMRQCFDPERFHIILFDQRGCGRSTPVGNIDANTTDDLLNDIEQIRKQLNIDKWILFGGSWGSTLSLIYAILHPERVIHMALRGIFLGTKHEKAWIYGPNGCAHFHPNAYAHLIKDIDPKHVVKDYNEKLQQDNIKLAKQWAYWEIINSQLIVSDETLKRSSDEAFALGLAKISAHYFHHDFFIEDDYIMKHLDRIQHIPCFIVHGRYDILCPVVHAIRLAKALPLATLSISPSAGHSLFEKDNLAALIKFMNETNFNQ